MVLIKPNEPLPDHTKLDYDECLAKLILETLFPGTFTELHLSDKPDLRDYKNHIGIEVTSAIPKEHKEALKLWYTMPYVKSQEKRNRNIERMKQLGVEYTGGIQVWPEVCFSSSNVNASPFNDVIKAFDKKIRKLNSGSYANMERYDLYVETELPVWLDIIPNILDKLLECNQGEKKFSFVYLYCLDALCVFNLNEQWYKLIRTGDKLNNLGIEARKIVESGEINEQPERVDT